MEGSKFHQLQSKNIFERPFLKVQLVGLKLMIIIHLEFAAKTHWLYICMYKQE